MSSENGFSKKRDLIASIYAQDKHWRNNVACLLHKHPPETKI
jgi:hypothetical protein